MIEEILAKAKSQMEEVLQLIDSDLRGVKTGRAKPSLIEDVLVEAYETKMKLRELAAITAPDPHSLVVSPWDKTILEKIERAVNTSDLNLHALVDNELIRINIPPLTEENRRDLVKLVSQKLESGRKLIRQARAEIKREIEELKGKPGVSEDDIKKWLDELQKLINETTEKIEELGKTKEQELMKI